MSISSDYVNKLQEHSKYTLHMIKVQRHTYAPTLTDLLNCLADLDVKCIKFEVMDDGIRCYIGYTDAPSCSTFDDACADALIRMYIRVEQGDVTPIWM